MNIFIYGDSNTVGYKPNADGYKKDAVVEYYEKEQLWWYPLTKNHNVVVNAKCGRCICHENKWLENRNAKITFMQDLYLSYDGDEHKINNLDLFIIMLGTNDFKSEYNDSIFVLLNGLNDIIGKLKNVSPKAEIMIISPPQIIEGTPITEKYYKNAKLKVAGFNYQSFIYAKRNNFLHLSAMQAKVGEDGEHLLAEGHKFLGQNVCKYLNSFFGVVEEEMQ